VDDFDCECAKQIADQIAPLMKVAGSKRVDVLRIVSPRKLAVAAAEIAERTLSSQQDC
jgi:hypothetical protein